MTEILAIVNTVGFPIFVAIWMLVKDQSEKEKTREALVKLTEAINRMTDNRKGDLNERSR